MVGRATGLCPYNSIKVMYQWLLAYNGNVSQDCRTAWCGTDRISKNKEKSNETPLFLSLWVTTIHLMGNSEKLVGKSILCGKNM